MCRSSPSSAIGVSRVSRVRPRYRADRAILLPRNPRNGAAIVKAHDEIGIKVDAPALPNDQAHRGHSRRRAVA